MSDPFFSVQRRLLLSEHMSTSNISVVDYWRTDVLTHFHIHKSKQLQTFKGGPKLLGNTYI